MRDGAVSIGNIAGHGGGVVAAQAGTQVVRKLVALGALFRTGPCALRLLQAVVQLG